MKAFNNTGGNCFDIIPPTELHFFVQNVKDPVREGRGFGHILFLKADCKGKGGEKYYMAVDYLEIMLRWQSGEEEPNWEPVFQRSAGEFLH